MYCEIILRIAMKIFNFSGGPYIFSLWLDTSEEKREWFSSSKITVYEPLAVLQETVLLYGLCIEKSLVLHLNSRK